MSGRGLTQESLDALLAVLDGDRERAGERYEAIRHRLVRLFEWRGCSCPEDLADETLNRVARRLAEGLELQAADPLPYFFGVAHLVFKETVRRETRAARALEAGGWPPPDPPEPDPDPRLEPLQHCLQTLAPDQRRLLLRYHQEEQRIAARKRLCEEIGIPLNALRIRVHRLRRKLELCIQERLRR